MKNRVATRFSAIERSATLAILELVQSLRAQGVSVLDLSGGQPDFATADHITAAASTALREGFTHYTSSRGLPALVQAVADKLGRENGVVVDPASDVIITPSAKHALFLSLMTVLDPGDEIIIPTPSWVSYGAMANLVGARPVAAELPAAQGFRITRQLLEPHVTSRSKALLLNTPNNPTGNALSRQEADEVAAFAREHDLYIITDEIYEKLLFNGERHISMASVAGCAERTLTVNGFSKAYAMTGWRLGYVAGPTDVMRQMLKVQEATVSCAGSFVQRGGVAALTGPQAVVDEMVAEYAARRALMVAGLDALPGIACTPPDGTFYAFADVRGTGFASSADFARWLLEQSGVAVTPGSAFGPGGEGYVRLSFATSPDVIRQALERMAAALARGSLSLSR